MNQILINAIHEEEVRIAVVKNKVLVDLDIESALNQKNKGNIYLGKISRIEESLEAVFVNYGKERQGFLPLKEICKYHYPKDRVQDKLKISEIFKEGQQIIVQIEKEERGNKGAALTTFINLVSTYIIFMPTKNNGVNISKQLRPSDRKKLQQLSAKLNIPQNSSIILRTIAEGKGQEELQWEIDYLKNLWDSILDAAKNKPAPFLIFQEGNIVIRSIRDYLRSDINSVIIDDEQVFNQVREFITFVLPHYLHKIKFFEGNEKSLFNYMGIEPQVQNIFSREIALSSGGILVFDSTEALTSIDINSARDNKGADIEETAYNTNLEAAKEISKQLQLRDTGGLVVIDFIDMSSAEHRSAVKQTLEQAFAKDRAKTHIGEISNFGLLEMSRQRIRSTISEATHQTCDKCNGHGVTPTVPGLAVQILRDLESNCSATKNTTDVIIRSSIEVVTYLLNEKRHYITQLELKYRVRITLLPHGYKNFPYYDIKKKIANNITQKSYQSIPKKELLPNILTQKPVADIPKINIFRPEKPIPTKKKSSFMLWFNSIFAKKEQQPKHYRPKHRSRKKSRSKAYSK